MGVIWFRTRIYNYNRNDKKVYLKTQKHKWYHIMEIKDAHLYSHQEYTDLCCLSGEDKLEDRHYGLAEYIDEDDPLYNLVKVIDYYTEDGYLIFRCTGKIREEDEDSIQLLKEYIEGQISDGAWENGIYLLECMIGDKVRHYWVEDEIEEVIIHPFKHNNNRPDSYVFVPGNHKTLKALIDEDIAAYKAAHKK